MEDLFPQHRFRKREVFRCRDFYIAVAAHNHADLHAHPFCKHSVVGTVKIFHNSFAMGFENDVRFEALGV